MINSDESGQIKCGHRDRVISHRDVIIAICSRPQDGSNCGAFNKQETLTVLQRLLYVGLNLLTASEKMPTKHYNLRHIIC